MSDDLARLSGQALAAKVRSGEVSAEAAVESSLAVIARRNPLINAFTAVTEVRARAKARAIDRARASGAPLGPLAGVPFAVKNLFDIEGLPTLAGSKINAGIAPAAADARLVQRLEAAGAILLGALNMGEYAYDFTGENSHYGPSRNPHDPSRMSGGSSGGSGAAVAAGMVPIALGSDTNGSIRVPSSLCGTFGLKPTYGRLSRHGSFLFAGSFDHLGPLARSVADLALSYDAMQGEDPNDPAQARRPAEPCWPSLADGAERLKIAVADGYFARSADEAALAAVAKVAAALGVKDRVGLPEPQRARSAAYVITAIEGANLHSKRLCERPQDFDPDTRDRFLAGLLLPGHWYAQAQRFRRWYRDRVKALFSTHDILLAPATPCTAPAIGQTVMVLDGQEVPVRPSLGIFTQPISFIGLPVVAVPVQRPGGLPIGVQIIAAPWREADALSLAAKLEAMGVVEAPIAELH